MKAPRRTGLWRPAVEPAAWLRRGPASQECEYLLAIVMVAIFQLRSALRPQQLAGIIQHKEMREPRNFRITRENALVFVLRAEVDLDEDKVLMQEGRNVLLVVEELIELFAPNAPLAANIEQHPSSTPLRFRNAIVDVLLRIAGRIELGCRDVTQVLNRVALPAREDERGKQRRKKHKRAYTHGRVSSLPHALILELATALIGTSVELRKLSPKVHPTSHGFKGSATASAPHERSLCCTRLTSGLDTTPSGRLAKGQAHTHFFNGNSLGAVRAFLDHLIGVVGVPVSCRPRGEAVGKYTNQHRDYYNDEIGVCT